MPKRIVWWAVFVFVAAPWGMAVEHLMRFADVSQTHIVFTFENDLWLVPIEGGKAHRITRAAGNEIFAKFSPDGKRIAFTGEVDGGDDVFVMDLDQGGLTRLTFHPARDLVVDWHPNGKEILFRSRRGASMGGAQLYSVPITGGMPKLWPLDRCGLASLSPDGTSIAFNRISREFRTWKRHQGGTAQDLWFGDLETGTFSRGTTFEGTDSFPMWAEDGVYFSSDRKHGTLNLFKMDPATREISQLTDYDDYDVMFPSLGGQSIVFHRGGSLYLLNRPDGSVHKVAIETPTDGLPMRDEFVDPVRAAGAFGLSPKGARAVFDIRGDIVHLPVDEGIAYNLTGSPGTREKNPAWSPDGGSIAFWSDRTGEEELCLADPHDRSSWKVLTEGNQGFRAQPVWSPDSKYLLYHDKFMRLNLLDVDTLEVSLIDQGEYDDGWYRWGIQEYVWSSDSQWVAYSKLEQSGYGSIFLYSLKQSKIYRVTDTMTEDWCPSFSPDGKYLYFLSNRTFAPIMGRVDQNHIFLNLARPYVLILKDGEPSPFVEEDRFDADLSAKPKGMNGNGDAAETPTVEVSVADFVRRIVAAPVPAGNLFRLEAVPGGFLYLKRDKPVFIKYQEVTDSTRDTDLDLYRFALDADEPQLLLKGIAQYHLSQDGKKLIYKSGRLFGVVDADKPAKLGDGKLDLSQIHIKVDKHQEFLQIFNEAWRVQRDWFYDDDMHGVNWRKVGEKYRKLVPLCGTREDLNFLIGEMIGELNAGHTYVGGGDVERAPRAQTGLLGVDLDCQSARYPRIERIVPGNNWDDSGRSPFEAPGCPVTEGDYLLAIDGVEIQDNVYRLLEQKADTLVEVTFNDQPTFDGAQKTLIKTLASERQLRYRDWVDRNRATVAEKTKGMVGYVHIPAMGEDGLIEFAKSFYPQYYKDGMIIDVRYNGGGFVSKQIIDRIERQVNSVMQPREGKTSPIPERTFHGHYVLLINADTGSDGEIFSDAWQRRGFGPIIGKRTWGGAVGIEPHQDLMDGGVTTPPQFGEFSLDQQWIIEGRGVEPDIEVDNLPADVVNGVDTQLDRGIDELLEAIAKDPRELPATPDYPDKSKATLK